MSQNPVSRWTINAEVIKGELLDDLIGSNDNTILFDDFNSNQKKRICKNFLMI